MFYNEKDKDWFLTIKKIEIMTKYEKYVDDDNVYHYELTLENGNKHWVKKELGDYLHSLEQQVKNLSLSNVSKTKWTF